MESTYPSCLQVPRLDLSVQCRRTLEMKATPESGIVGTAYGEASAGCQGGIFPEGSYEHRF